MPLDDARIRRVQGCMQHQKSYAGLETISVALANEQATRGLGRTLAGILQPGDIVALGGTLGAGKTCLARGTIRALLGYDEDVPSPTFTLVQVYETDPAPVYHFDCYRLENPDEAPELGIEDAFADGISLIEWPENMGSWLPRCHLKIDLSADPTTGGRQATLSASDPGWQARLNDWSPP